MTNNTTTTWVRKVRAAQRQRELAELIATARASASQQAKLAELAGVTQ